MSRLRIALVTPAVAAANNGNWQTARRWAHFLRPHRAGRGRRAPRGGSGKVAEPQLPESALYRVRCSADWQAGDEALMIALHARRSAPSIAAWRQVHPGRPLVVVLTGTDLYRDIASDAAAQRSLELADRLVVLNECGLAALPAPLRPKARICLQSAPPRRPQAKTGRHLRALMVGHLREEKSPRTYFDAARRLAQRRDIRLDHIGGALDPVLADEARALMQVQPRYRWLGELPHAATRERIQRAHVLVHASRMEGGAHVVIEAVTSGTPVLASRIDGNVGLLGAAYGGYFEPGDAAGLSTLLQRGRDDPSMLAALAGQCALRAPLFDPARERHTLQTLLAELLPQRSSGDRR